MSQRNVQKRQTHTAYSSSPMMNVQWAFFASWRGQLVICGIAILIGGVVFFLQEPYARFRTKRREALSKVREKELMSMEKSDTDEKLEENKEKEKRGKERRRDQKKRKGSLLRVPNAEFNTTSIESSPNPADTHLPRSTRRPSASGRGRVPSTQMSTLLSTPRKPHPAPPAFTLLEPSPVILDSTSKTFNPPLPRPLDTREIPLPPSPYGGPSRLSFSEKHDQESNDGDSGNTSESASNLAHSDAPPEKSREPLNFSIIPEEGYLPAQIQTNSAKKKKRKGRTAPPPLPTLERRSSKTDVEVQRRASGSDSPSIPITPSRHARKASLTRPPNADLDALLTEREKMIESLRAEIGLAKAEEYKAKDGLTKLTATVERLQGDYERARKVKEKADHESRKREGELNARLTHLSSQHATALARIHGLETLIRESGQPFPQLSPAIPPPGQSPVPIQFLQSIPSPMPPSSPFTNGFGPSPRSVSAGFIPYPSPGMYPSPMLHPHYHTHSPSPFRRASTAGLEESLAGPLTPGHPPTASGSYPFDLGIMPPPAPAQPIPSNGQLSASDLRRMSIESSVMKKKVKQESENGEETKHLETLEDVSENSIREDGENESSAMQKDVAGDSGSGSSHPSSPSPPNRASMLLTPASADLFHRALIQGAETPDEFQRDISHIDLRQIKVVSDAEDGCFPSDGPAQPGSEGDVASDNASAYEPDDKENATLANGHEVEGHGVEVAKEDYVPMFASIAHTPQQVREIKQMRERVIKARESRSSSRSHESIET